MNGAATRRGGSGGRGVGRADGAVPAAMQPLVIMPPGKALVEGYRKDILSGFEKETPRYNPLNTDRPQSSPLVDLKDPIQVHLLTETALSDSKPFEILSQEEVDDLKKQIQSLSMRVEQARANLAIQSKYRDAAISMARLYSPSKADGRRRSLLGNRTSDSAREAETEKLASERRCEELATELFSLEKRLMESQRRLLQHTAGILQMTHRASAKKPAQPLPVGPMMNGIPGSPESLYTYTNARDSMEVPGDELDFDYRSLYLPVDQIDRPATRPRKNTIEIPMKSPIREQNVQLRELREELARVKEENEQILEENIALKTSDQQMRGEIARSEEEQARARDEISRLQSREQQLANEHPSAVEENSRIRGETSRMLDETSRFNEADSRLRAVEQQMSAETEALRAQSAGQLRTIADTEARLEALNRRLRDVVVAFNPAKNERFGSPGAAAGSGEALPGQLEYLEMALATAVEEQRLCAADASRAAEEAAAEASAASAEAAATAASLGEVEAALDQAALRAQTLVRQVQVALQQSNASLPPPPEGALDKQLDYLEEALGTVTSELSRALEASSSASSKKQSMEQVDAVLMGLWEIIQTGYAEIEQQRAARMQNRAMDDDDLSSNESDGYSNEPYSLQAFSTKVQWLYAQATGLREQKYILQRQIKQQRELNNRSESEKDRELTAKSGELAQTKALLDAASRAARDAQAELDRLRAHSEAALDESASGAQEARARVAALEADLGRAQTELSASAAARQRAESDLAALQAQLASATEAAASADAQRLRQDLQAKDEELDRMNTMVVELKTEVAFAKAELDGAYGSRKQRAAEAAAAAAAAASTSKGGRSKEEAEELSGLRVELESALRDLEEITRESIAAEREKVELEGRLDEAVAVRGELEGEVERLRERLEREVGRLQEELDKERLRVPPAPGGGRGAGGAGVAGATAPRAGATMLSQQFRATMKEERKKFQEERKKIQEELREEQTRRRKLEEELRSLRRSQGPGAAAGSARGALSPR